MRATIREVAKRAGVSAMTVSRVLNERHHLVADETREAILKVVRELSYIPVRTTIQNRRVETRTLGLISHYQDITTHFVGKNIFAGIHDGARRRGYDLLAILRSRPDWAAGRQEAVLLDKRADGYIFSDDAPAAALKILCEHSIPAVACNTVYAPEGVACVAADGRMQIRLALQHLIACGHRRIGHLAGARRHAQGRERRKQFNAEAAALGLRLDPAWIVEGDWVDNEKDIQATQTILKQDVTAVICGGDSQALRLLDEAAKLGRRVPAELSIIGIDNSPPAQERGLTTLTNPFAEIGRAAVDAMVEMLNGKPAKDACRLLPVELIVRNSVANLAGRE